jgi:glycosyltransferase involved in cell wall biosynthesis
MGKISVIIPLYKGHDTLVSALHSVAMQSIINETEIVIVNDFDGVDYSDILSKFDNLNIKYVTNPRNLGCAGARNTGIREASNSIICFIDSDDQFISSLSLEIMYNRIIAEKADVLVSVFESEMRFADGVAIKQMKNAVTWTHGKLYRRQYLLDNNIFFDERLRINEDCLFHQLLFDSGAKVVEIPMVTLMWRDNPKSLTHESLYKNKRTFVEAVTYYLEESAKRGLDKEKVTLRTLQNLCVMYGYYNIVLDDCPENKEDYLSACREWWKLAEDVTNGVSDEYITKVFLAVNKTSEVIPSVTLIEFLDELRAD